MVKWLLLLIVLILWPLSAQNTTAPADASKVNDDRDRKIEVLSEEVEKLKAGRELFPAVKATGKYGLGPAASKVYDVQQGVSIGGYGEMLYEKFAGQNQKGTDVTGSSVDQIDFARAIVYFGYKFNDKFVFNSEIEVEHVGEISLEFAYIDYLFDPRLNFRAGKILLPMGLINELHEPTVYLGAKRPQAEQFIIPSTWSENGAGVFGTIGDFTYKAFLINGFDALGTANGGKVDGYSASRGLRDGRQDGAEAKAVNFAGVVRADFVGLAGVLAGVSGYYGKAGQNFASGVTTWIADAHIDARYAGFFARTVFAYSQIKNVTEVFQQQQSAGVLTSPDQAIGSDIYGGYLEFGYNVFHLLNISHELVAYARFERVDTQYKQPAGFQRDGAADKTLYTLGIRYKPIVQLAVKSEYQVIRNGAETGVNQFNLSLGYIF